LFFEGRCEEAVEFYRRAVGAEVTSLMRYKECPEPAEGPMPDGEKVMHGSLRIGESTVFFSDGNCSGTPSFQGFALSLTTGDVAEAEQVFAALGDGGKVLMPIGPTFFSPRFGMLADRFGVMWMIYVAT
jgi:PhnB protein